jgi:glycine cleavage system H lipoate-binding protein
MAAGLVSYKLCDREFDCTRCPLDAALRGGGFARADLALLPDDGRRNQGFPDDRRYATGHTWLAACRAGAPNIRIGLDGFAAALLPRPVRISTDGSTRELETGDIVCDIELPEGTLSVSVPVAGRLVQENVALHEHPGLIVDSPYHDGWIVELVPSTDPCAADGLLDAAGAREQTELHLRHFRRRIGLQLLSETSPAGPCMADGGEVLTSLSEILGGRQYLRILREVLR